MNLLELFSGTQSFGKIGKEKGYNVISVDITDYNGKYIPTHKCDIMDFNYKQYDRNFFNVIHASPPCLNYSILQTSWYGKEKRDISTKELYKFTKQMHYDNMLESDIIVKKTLEIISYFNPKVWYLENPKTGKLKSREFMHGLYYFDIDYCMYSDWGYKKATRFWTNNTDFVGKICNKNCGNIIDNKHIVWPSGKFNRYRIPPTLIRELLE